MGLLQRQKQFIVAKVRCCIKQELKPARLISLDRDLSKKGSHKRQLEYAERTARKAMEQM
jgi:hypothetical protein